MTHQNSGNTLPKKNDSNTTKDQKEKVIKHSYNERSINESVRHHDNSETLKVIKTTREGDK